MAQWNFEKFERITEKYYFSFKFKSFANFLVLFIFNGITVENSQFQDKICRQKYCQNGVFLPHLATDSCFCGGSSSQLSPLKAGQKKASSAWPALSWPGLLLRSALAEPSASAGPSDQPPGQPLPSSQWSQHAQPASATGKGEVLSCSADCSVFEWLLPCAASQFLAHCSVLRRQPKQPTQPKFGPFRLGRLGRWR